MPEILGLWRWKWENQKFKVILSSFEASMGYLRLNLQKLDKEGVGLAQW